MADNFKDHRPGLSSPAESAFAITPDDATPLPNVTRAVYVGGAGDLRVTMLDGQTVLLSQVQPGGIYPLRCTRVWTTDTTATGLVGLY